MGIFTIGRREGSGHGKRMSNSMAEPGLAPGSGPLAPHLTGGIAGHPRGLTPLFFTELWERFSYYGMRALLMLYLVLPVAAGGLGYSVREAGLTYGLYTFTVYTLSIPGGYLADHFLGARRAVLIGGIIIAIGHFLLALQSPNTFLCGLGLIGLGTGLLKPNISTMVGALYPEDDPRRDSGFSIFYMGINIGALGPFITGYLAQADSFKAALVRWGFDPRHSWHWGFASAGVGMTLGVFTLLLNWEKLGRVGNPPPSDRPKPWGKLGLMLLATALFFGFVRLADTYTFLRYAYVGVPIAVALVCGFSRDTMTRRVAAIMVLFVAALIFWAVYEQAGTTIALFSDTMTANRILGIPFPSSFYQAIPSAFVIVLAGAFAWLWAALGRRQPSSPIKFTIGLGCIALSLFLMVPAAHLAAQAKVSPMWLVGLFFLQTVGELCLSPVGLSTMTKLAPPRFVACIMGIWFLADALGNKLAGIAGGMFDASDPIGLAHVFLVQGVVIGVATLVLLALSPWVKRLMGGIH